MDTPISEQIMALVATVCAMAFAAVVYADMYAHGLTQAVPRDLAALAVFGVMRWMIARAFRRTPQAVNLFADDSDDDTATLPIPPQRPQSDPVPIPRPRNPRVSD